MKVAMERSATTLVITAVLSYLVFDTSPTVRANQTTSSKVVADPDGAVITSERQKFKIEVIVRNLETPWGMAFEPDGKLLITERPGQIRIYDKGKLSSPVEGTPVPRVQQDGGYFDISLHPQFAKNGWIYLSYSEVLPKWTAPNTDNRPPTPPQDLALNSGQAVPSNTVIVRGKINEKNEWIDQQVIFQSPTRLYSSRGEHYGSRFLWDKEKHLYFTLGERG